MLTKDDVVYDLQIEDGKPTLRFVIIETRRPASHDQAAHLPDIPEIFAPVSLPGMAQAKWQANCLPMEAMGDMFDAGYPAFEDIDRLADLRASEEAEKTAQAFHEAMSEFAERAAKALEDGGANKGPWPAQIAAAILEEAEKRRRFDLAKARFEAEKATAAAGAVDNSA